MILQWVQQPADLQIVQNAPAGERRTVIGINNAPLSSSLDLALKLVLQ
jgi:hypothetical protein